MGKSEKNLEQIYRESGKNSLYESFTPNPPKSCKTDRTIIEHG